MVREPANRIAVVIPAYRPSTALVEVVRALVEKAFSAIVLIDDGSGPEFAEIFAGASAFPGVRLLRHAANLGRGAALKTGINHALCELPGLLGIVTADADGQYHPDDIERVAASLQAHPESLVLGCRTPGGGLRGRFGNFVTSGALHALMGRKIADTQTGLRGIPASFALRMLKVEAAGYEFELEMLVAAHRHSVPLEEEPIRTIARPGKPFSHFNPILDSLKTYLVLLRFGSVSLLTALLDNLVFLLATRYTHSVLTAQILGRIVAVGFNYSMARNSVFSSHQRHKTALPKYLLLVLASGMASYGAIRLLTAKLGIGVIPAKLFAETVLFFVNFAVERLFIFQPEEVPVKPPDAPAIPQRGPFGVPDGWLAALVLVVFGGLLAMEVYGFRTAKLFAEEIWLPVGLQRFLRFAEIYLGISLPLLLLAPRTFPGFITVLAAIATAVAIGPLPLLAVAFFLVSSCALGSLLLGRNTDAPELQLLSTLLGIAVWIFLMNLLARFPIHYLAIWVILLTVPILVDWRGAWGRLARWGSLVRHPGLRSIGERAAFALLVFVLLAHLRVALLPEISTDGLAMHLAISFNMAAHHALTFEPSRFLWAVMPMGADFVYFINYLLGGEYAAHLLNFALLLILEALLYFAVRRWVTRATAFLVLAMFASTPMVQLVTGSLFVENLVAALVLGFLAAIWRFGETGEKRFLYLAAVFGGTAVATKFGALALVAAALPFLIFEAARWWKSLGRYPVAACGLAAVLLLLTALPPYAIAYWKTADPLFPFLSDKFPTRLIPAKVVIRDLRFHQPLSWHMPYDLTFRTAEFYEGQNGSLGFQYLVLAPFGIAAVLLARRRSVAAAAVVSLVGAILVLGSEPNARYLYGSMLLLSVPFAALLGWAAGRRWLYHTLIWFTVSCSLMNLYFLPSASYYHRDFGVGRFFSRAARDNYIAYAAPIREVIAYCNRAHPNSTVLLTSDGTFAGLNGTVYENHWHQYATFDLIRHAGTLPELLQLIQSWNVQYLIAPKDGWDEVEPVLLKELLRRCSVPEFEVRGRYLARLQSVCRP